jgi:hypothetical protein
MQVDEVMRRARSRSSRDGFLPCRFHAAIDHGGIHAHDLQREALREPDREGRSCPQRSGPSGRIAEPCVIQRPRRKIPVELGGA